MHKRGATTKIDRIMIRRLQIERTGLVIGGKVSNRVARQVPDAITAGPGDSGEAFADEARAAR